MRQGRVRGRLLAGKRAAQRIGLPLRLRTGAPVSAANDALPTNRVAASVWMTRTAWPAFVASRVSSSAL